MRKAGAKSSVSPRRSSLERPKPITRPALRAASRARARASSGCRVREAATTIPTLTPVSASERSAWSSTISTAGVIPPTKGA